MSTDPARDPRTRRYPCAFCDQPDMWPDLCSETADAIDRRCAETIGSKCSSLGDHRRCASSSCTVASRWREPVRQAGMEAARAAGAVWAVVSTIENEIEVIGTETNLGRARSRQSMIQLRAGILPGSAFAGRVYVVRGTDGGFL